MLYPLWHAASLTDMQLISKDGDSKFGSSMTTALGKTGQFCQFIAIFEPQHG
jgi:hypothetical protein